MGTKLRLLFVLIFFSFAFNVYSTHIVGGSLTYIYNGGSSYTITMKLYRDCSPTSAAFPGTVLVNVYGYNGATFSPTKDISMTLGTVTPVPANLDPCALPPTPLPCVEEGIYTTTVNNLPPNPGGYHLSYQLIARNLSLSNVNAVCNCVGESFYAYIPGTTVKWDEDFALPNNTTNDIGSTAWSIAAGVPPPSGASVQNNQFEITGANNGVETWTSQVINSSSCGSFDVRVDLSENGNLDANDSIFVYYRLNGGPLTLFTTNGIRVDDFTNAVATVTGLSGATIQVIIRVHYDNNSPGSETYRFDNVVVACNDFINNSNPVFDLFPPLFLCVGYPFTFDHSATDADGDSLYYSFYTPYNGDNGPGPLDPTFVANTAIFTPIVWQPGFGVTNPLGGAPLNLNPNTGLLSGTPTMLGQFVVGVVVKEYRAGNYVSQTLRDFQFNVVNCPPPPVAVGGADITINMGCTGTLNATGFNVPTVTWTSITGGLGLYNSFLSCTSGCVNPNVTSTGTPPPFVDYRICGISASCNPTLVCDTIRVTFNPPLVVTIAPINPSICFGSTSTTITATGSGGTPPYSYLWNSTNPSPTITVGAGNYTVMLTDGSGCPPVYATVTVISFSVAITANAGPNDTICAQSPTATLNGSVTGATGGVWSGGGGVYSPNNTTLNANYTPTPAELAAGFVDLTLTTTGNGTCPGASDIVRIYFLTFTGTLSITPVHVGCFGGSNGTATATVTGGIPPFTYFWNTVPAQTTATATNLSVGTYTVTVTNGIGCTSTASVTITQPTPLAASAVITNVSCFSGNNGSISVTPSGGTPGYTYLWAPGAATTSSISGQTAGTYTVTITDTRGCQLTQNYTITQPTVLGVTMSQTNVSCAGGTNGTATATASGGTVPYTYLWSPSGGTASVASGLSAGTYTVTVTDNKGCTATGSVTITQPVILTATTAVTNETCSTLNNGTALVTPAGGTPGYTYLWAPGGMTTASVTSLAAGTYTVTVTDTRGCNVTVFATITQPPVLAVTMNQVDVNCFGGSTGSVTASPSGGTPTYSYLWSPGGATTSTVTGLAAGTYSVTVTDLNGCTVLNNVTITQPIAALSVSPVITNVSCSGGSDGSITATPSGGTPGYTYLWLPGGQTTPTITGKPAGTYTLTVTDSKGCQITVNYTITQPAPLAISFVKTDVSCFGGNNGTATGTVTGGTASYSYVWTPSGGTLPTASGLAAGTYTLTVTDNNGCVFAASITITQPTVLTLTTSITNETCSYLNDGTATALPVGGTPAYTYLWAPGGMTTVSVSSLSAGTYTVTATDSRGCTATATAIISQPIPLAITFDFHADVSCFGGSDGVLSAAPSGGTPSYSYLWAPGGSTSNVISGLAAGTYTLTVTDINGCQVIANSTITQPAAAVSIAVSSTPTSCFGGTDGTVSAVGSGGTPGYSYVWMPGILSGANQSGLSAGTYTVSATDTEGCTTTNTVAVVEPGEIILTTSTVNSNCGTPSGQASVSVSGGVGSFTYLWMPGGITTPIATGLLSGSYTITVTDGNGCTSVSWANVNDNSGPTATIFDLINVSCFGGSDGSASVSVTGGVGPYTYMWTPSGGTGVIASGLSAGTYTVTVIDSVGCQSNATTSPAISEPPPIVIGVTTTPVSCFGGTNGTATALATGGTPGYTYQWLPGGTFGTSVTGLSATITYTVQVTDANSCIQNQTFTISEPAAALSIAISSTPVNCFGENDGSASAIASGGTAPYAYTWMPGGSSGSGIGALVAGTYTVTVTDLNGCTLTNSVAVTQPTLLTLTSGSNNSSCGSANGYAFVSAAGGVSPYDYQWFPGGSINDTAFSLLPGNYLVTVTDNNGCSDDAFVTVNDNTGPTATISAITNVSCFGGSDGTATVSVFGGSSPFGYSWSPIGGTGSTATGLPAGSYTVTVTDSNGCISIDTTSPSITEPDPIVISLSTTDVSCFGGSNGSASAIVFGGNPGYTYLWLPGATSGSTVNSLSMGTYTLQVTDANLCMQADTFNITQPTVLSASILSSTNVSCFGGADGTATVGAAGGTPFYTYNWLPSGGTGATAIGLSVGNYTVTATDLNGCTTTATVSITEPAAALSASTMSSATSCFGGSDGGATATVSGGTPSYTYLWSPSGGSSSIASGLSPGNYTVMVTDTNGCTSYASAIITEPTAITGTLVVVEPSCGFANGSITSMISGGTSPYNYLWTPGGATTANITGLAPGAYSLQVTDNNGCIAGFGANLTNIPGPTVSIPLVSNANCFGSNDGTATASISSGTGPYNIIWLPYGGSSATATGLIADSYTVVVTDALGCIDSSSVVITEPTPVNLTLTSLVTVSCNGGSDATITVNATGGTPGYTYSWAPIPSALPTITGLPAGTYTATANDANGCPATMSIIVTEPATLTSAMGTVLNPSCFSSANGSAEVVGSGGTIPYSYLWSDGQTGSTAVLLAAGSYSVTVTDSEGCTSTSTVLLTEPTQIITSAGINDTVCLGSPATLTVSAVGGVSGYYYVWQPTGGISGGTYNVTPTANTTYTVVAYDADGCAGTPDTVSAIVYDLSGATIDAITTLSPICPGQNSSVYVSVSGIPGPLTYSWNNGLGTGPGAYTVSPIVSTTYIVSVSNSCGVTVTDSVEVLISPPPTVTISSDTTEICAPGCVQFFDSSVSGNATDPIHYWTWDFGDGTTSGVQDPVHCYSQPGTYNVYLTVTTGNGCTNNTLSAPYVINAYPYPVAAFSINSTTLDLPYDPLICTNSSVGASTYLWNFGDGNTSTATNPNYLYSTVGIYPIELIATNIYGCSDTAYAQVVTNTDVTFPNVFTPDGGGSSGGGYNPNALDNNVFFPFTSGVEEFNLQIFNRWGELIFESNALSIGWDGYYKGKLCQQDVYIWKARIKLNNGRTFNKSGDVTLLR